jgi:hypothetical protein
MAAVGAMYWWGTGRRGPLGFAAAWTAASYLAAHLPGLFWQHYYLLGLPGLVMLAAAGFGQWAGDISAAIQTRPRWAAALACGWCATGGVLAATLAAIQYSDYWRLEPEQIAMRHKGGEQWVELRRVSLWLRPLGDRGEQALVWGWQSPLHVYSRMDSVTPYFFTDPLMKKYAASYHPLVEPRKQRILQDAREHRPAIVFAGDRPFPELARFLNRDYVPLVVQEERGLYVRPDIAEHVRKALQEPRRP